MKEFLTSDMMEALRLTRQGQLKAAVSLLRRKGGDPPSASPSRPSAPQFGVPPGILSGAMEKLARLGRSPLLDGLPGLGPKQAPIQQPPGSRFEERDFKNAAGSRKYKLFVPGGYHGQALPLVVMLHGCTQSPDDFAAGTRMNGLAEEQGFFVAYPAQSSSANITKCWNWFNPADQQRDHGEPSIIAGITQQIISEFAVRPGKVYVAGLSAGGAAAAILGARYPDLYTAIGVHSGLACGSASDLPSAMLAMRRGGAMPHSASSDREGARRIMPTIVFHGDSDATVNVANAGQVIAQSKAGAQLRSETIQGSSQAGQPYTRTVQSAAGKPLLEEWILHKAGHAWSGGSTAGSFTWPEGPDASREMLRFFMQQ